jgi:exo-beta-1,3-glucanase (GH17 family)
VHPYGGTGVSQAQSALGNRALVTAAYNATGLPVYVTEVGWPTAVGQPPTGDSLQWTEQEQAENIYNFVDWARSTGYVNAVMIFTFRDYGTNNFYGIEQWSNPAGPNGSLKPSYYALQEAAQGLPLTCSGC